MLKIKEDNIDNIIYIVGLFIIYSVIHQSYKKSIYFLLCIMIIFGLFTLDLSFALKIEGKIPAKILQIDQKKFNNNNIKEISRYTDDVIYYNNIWRISLVASLVISLCIVNFIPIKYISYMPYIVLVLFSIIYHAFNWKVHHSYDFMFKNIKHAVENIGNNDYEPIKHI